MSQPLKWRPSLWFLGVIWLVAQPAAVAEDISAEVARYLDQGDLAAAGKTLRDRLSDDPNHDQARFALGVVEVLSAIEKLGQDQYRFGALSDAAQNIPVLRVPIPVNPKPEEVAYQQVRDIFQEFQTRLVRAEAELAKVDMDSEVQLPLDLASIRLDLTGDGQSDEKETFLQIFGVANRRQPNAEAQDMRVVLDAGDVPWLRGYCHFLMSFCDLVLAYDHQRLFDHCGQLIYPRHIPSEKRAGDLDLPERRDAQDRRFDVQIVDFIAAIHLVNLPLKEPERLEAARQHLLEMIRTSRQSWELILKETDNDREWLPNPKQTGILRVPVTQQVIDGWHGVLAEMEDLLEGRKLVPFWRDYYGIFGPGRNVPAEGRGVNLKLFFQEPRAFDLILAIQGTGMLPFVEQGKLSRPETWNNLSRVFQGRFFGFAVWFN